MFIFKYDLENFDMEECKSMADKIEEIIYPEKIITIPKTCDLYRLKDNEFAELFKGE